MVAASPIITRAVKKYRSHTSGFFRSLSPASASGAASGAGEAEGASSVIILKFQGSLGETGLPRRPHPRDGAGGDPGGPRDASVATGGEPDHRGLARAPAGRTLGVIA